MTPLRGLLLTGLLLAAGLAGCAGPGDAPDPDPDADGGVAPPAEARTLLLAMDGRWSFPRERGQTLMERTGAGTLAGAAWFGGGILHADGMPHAADYAAFDAEALAALAPGGTLSVPSPGHAYVSARLAQEAGLAQGDTLDLAVWRWPTPLVSTSFEMDRTRECLADAPAKLCFAPSPDSRTTELRLRVDEGSRDLSFLPDMAELGSNGAPAWWNGTFLSPTGVAHPFQAHVNETGHPTSGILARDIDPGTWTIRFRLDTRNGPAPAGLAGIVRIREPGYLWFDDRLQDQQTPHEQARAVLARANATNRTFTVAATTAFPGPIASFDLLLHPQDARDLRDLAPDRVQGLLVRATPDAEHRLNEERLSAPDAVTLALFLRPLGPPLAPAAPGDALVFRAPPDLPLDALPPVDGAREPLKALALRPHLGANAILDGKNLTTRIRLLAPAEGGAPFTLPPGARWPTVQQALENLSRSRTLALASGDLFPSDRLLGRLVLGDEQAGRIAVVVGAVVGGPGGTFWVSAPLAAGAGEPEGAKIVLPLAPGADRAAVLARAREAWAPHGAAPEGS